MRRSYVLVLAGLLALACSNDDADLPAPPPSSTVVARFNLGTNGLPALLDIPFPSDAYRKVEGGRHVEASATFQDAVARRGPLGALYGAVHERVLAILGAALKNDGATVSAIAPYTTQANTGELAAAHDAIEAAPAKRLAWD